MLHNLLQKTPLGDWTPLALQAKLRSKDPDTPGWEEAMNGPYAGPLAGSQFLSRTVVCTCLKKAGIGQFLLSKAGIGQELVNSCPISAFLINSCFPLQFLL